MKACLHCKLPITERTSRATFCSRVCKTLARYEVHREYAKDHARRKAAETKPYRDLVRTTKLAQKAFKRDVAKHCSDLAKQEHAPEQAQRPSYHDRLKQYIADYKTARGCQVCGVAEPSYILDLHHVDPATKLFGFARPKSQRLVDLEFLKCVVLCAVHHRMVENGDIQLEKGTA